MKIAVLGSGNGAHAVAFEWARAGHDIYMYDFEQFPKAIEAISKAGGIYSEGQLEGFQKIEYAGHDIEKAIVGADIVFVVGPAYSTEPFGEVCKGHAVKGQLFIICPGSCFGSVVFKKTLGLDINDDSIIVSETSTLPYAVRIIGDAKIAVYNRLPSGYLISSLPKEKNDQVYDVISKVHEGIEKAASVLQTTLQNANPILHPTITSLNAGRVESTKGDFYFYEDGVTPSVGRLLKALDNERIMIGERLGVKILSDPEIGVKQGYMVEASYDNGYSKAPGFKGIMAPDTLNSRFYDEDAGYGLVLLTDLARKVNLEVPTIDMMIRLSSIIRDRDYKKEKARTLEKLGLDNYSIEELKAL